MKIHFILPLTIRKRFSVVQTIDDINFYRIFGIIFKSDLVISYTETLLVFQLVQIVLLL